MPKLSSPNEIKWKGKKCPAGRTRNKKTKMCVKKKNTVKRATTTKKTSKKTSKISTTSNNSILSSSAQPVQSIIGTSLPAFATAPPPPPSIKIDFSQFPVGMSPKIEKKKDAFNAFISPMTPPLSSLFQPRPTSLAFPTPNISLPLLPAPSAHSLMEFAPMDATNMHSQMTSSEMKMVQKKGTLCMKNGKPCSIGHPNHQDMAQPNIVEVMEKKVYSHDGERPVIMTNSYLVDRDTNAKISVQNQNELQYALKNPESAIYKKVVNDVIMKPFKGYDAKSKMLRDEFMKKIIWRITKNKGEPMTDKEIYDKMHQWVNKYYYPVVGYPNVESDARSMVRVHDIMYMLKQMGTPVPATYVDVGCSEGGITQLLGQEMGLNHVYGLDIIDESELKKVEGTNVEMTYIKMSPESVILPFADESVDFITALMSLHHIAHYAEYIKEIGRILKRSGVLIIQEHNTTTEDDKIAIDILHGMYTMVWAKTGEREDETFCETYSANYKSRNEWTEQIENQGLVEVDLKEPAKWKAIPRNNIHNNYWAVYIKK